jgi:hypothetical protein
MKALVNISALFLSVILGLLPFAVIAVDESAAARADVIQGIR